VKPTKTQLVFAYVASIALMLTVFHRPLGLADYWEWVFDAICLPAWTAFFALRRKQKARASEPDQIVAPPSVSRQKNIMRLSLFLIVAVSLAGPWWLRSLARGFRFHRWSLSPSLPASHPSRSI